MVSEIFAQGIRTNHPNDSTPLISMLKIGPGPSIACLHNLQFQA